MEFQMILCHQALRSLGLRLRTESRLKIPLMMQGAKISTDKLFTNEKQTALYAKFRPTYSPAVFETIISFCKEKAFEFELAVDAGCGSGQSTIPLTKHFKKVIGSDVSDQQVANAPKNIPNLSFLVSRAEELGFVEKSSVDLVTIAMAIHWVDRDRFYKEVDRVLKPGGCLVAYGYGIPELSHPGVNKCFSQMYNDVLSPYWSDGRLMVEQKYATVTLPYPHWRRDDSLTLERECTIEDFVGYLGSWSAVQTMQEREPWAKTFLNDITVKFRSEMGQTESNGEKEAKLIVSWPVYILMGRKPL